MGANLKGGLAIKVKFLIIIILLMGLCYDIALIFSFEIIYPEEMEITCICEVIKEKESKEYYDKYILKVIENKILSKSKNTKLILYIKKDKEYKVGDIIKVKGNFQKGEVTRNYKGFSYRKYLSQNKIYGIIFADETNIISQRQDLYFVFGKIRAIVEERIDKLYKGEYANFLKGLLIGNKSELDENIIEDFQTSSISHILAISGLHISFILVGINFILEKIINSKNIRNYLLIGFLIFFLILTGNSVSCMRACIMNIFMLLSFGFHRKNNFFISFIWSFIIIIFFNPYNLFNVGMWLSYGGTIGIVINYNCIYKIFCIRLGLKKETTNYNKKYLEREHKNFNVKSKLKNLKLNKNRVLSLGCKNSYYKRIREYCYKIQIVLLKSFCISLSAQILILPIMIYVFNTFSLTFFISNILVSFFIAYVLFLGYISIFVSFIFFPIANLIAVLEKIMVDIILKIANITSKLPLSRIFVVTPSLSIIILYYLLYILWIIYFNYNKFHILRVLLSKRKINTVLNKVNLINIKSILKKKQVIRKILICILIIIIIANTNKFSFNLKIHFIDVGQGDCTLIITPSGKRIIVDGGEGNSEKYDYGKNIVFPYLLDRGINRIDYLVISHADSDHIGGLIYVLENINVENILIGIQPESSKQLEDLLDIAKRKKVMVNALKKGDIINIDKNTKIEVIWPDINNLILENNLNNNSLVFKLFFNKFSILFTGDIEESAEKLLCEIYENTNILNSDILKIAHHGSKSSSTLDILKSVKPQIALIGVGKNNKYGHPNQEVIDRLNKIGVNIYRTDQLGEITIKVTSKGKITVKKFIE